MSDYSAGGPKKTVGWGLGCNSWATIWAIISCWCGCKISIYIRMIMKVFNVILYVYIYKIIKITYIIYSIEYTYDLGTNGSIMGESMLIQILHTCQTRTGRWQRPEAMRPADSKKGPSGWCRKAVSQRNYLTCVLVGGLEHECYFSIYWE